MRTVGKLSRNRYSSRSHRPKCDNEVKDLYEQLDILKEKRDFVITKGGNPSVMNFRIKRKYQEIKEYLSTRDYHPRDKKENIKKKVNTKKYKPVIESKKVETLNKDSVIYKELKKKGFL